MNLHDLNTRDMRVNAVGTKVRLRVAGGIYTGIIVEIDSPPVPLLSPRYKVKLDHSGEITGWLYKSYFTKV